MSNHNNVILLGAGASYQAGVPTAIPMIDKMAEVFEKKGLPTEIRRAYSFVVSTLRGNSSIPTNIETVYQAVESISERSKSVSGSFISEWNPEIIELENKLPKVFEYLVDFMKQALVDLTYIDDPSRVHYYLPLVDAAMKTKTPIFTLNYDNAVELACKSLGIPVDFGLASYWAQKKLVSFDGPGLMLAKLHGSVTWSHIPSEFWGPQFFFDFSNPAEMHDELLKGETLPFVIFGATNKLSAQAFMLDYVSEFISRLEPDTILHVVGYGFGDEHINQIIARWHEQGGLALIYDVKSQADFYTELVWKPSATTIGSSSGKVPQLDVYGNTSADVALSELIPRYLMDM